MKRFKRIITNLAVAIVLFFSLCIGYMFPMQSESPSVASVSAKADEETQVEKLERLDDHFEFEQGAALTYERKDGASESKWGLKFDLEMPTTKVANFMDHEKDTFLGTFTVYRVGAGESYTPIYRMMSYTWCVGNLRITVWGHKALTYDANTDIFSEITFKENQKEGLGWFSSDNYTTDDEKKIAALSASFMEQAGNEYDFTVVRQGNNQYNYSISKENNRPSLGVTLMVNSPAAEYFVGFAYKGRDFLYTKKNFWGKKTDKRDEDTYVGEIHSDIRSVKTVLTNMQEAGAVEEELGSVGEYRGYSQDTIDSVILEADTIVRGGSLQTVNVSWLKAVGETPFAVAQTATVEVPVFEGKIYYDDVAAATGERLHCLGSNVEGFTYDEADNMYQANYLKNIWLAAKDASSHTANYFLDINLSYEDYFAPLVSDGAIEQDLYDYGLNSIKGNYKAMAGYTAEEIHGFFGYVVIPKDYSLNQLWKEVLSKPAEFEGVVSHFEFKDFLSKSEYETLTDKYNYTWLEQLWGKVIGSFDQYEASHYVFYADPMKKEAVLSHDGSTDVENTSGLIVNEAKDAVENVTNAVQEWVNSTQKERNAMKIFLSVLLGVVLIGGAIFAMYWLYRKAKSLP